MDTDREEPIYKAESQAIVECAVEILNEIGHGFEEKLYENALVVEFRLRGISYEPQKQFDIISLTGKGCRTYGLSRNRSIMNLSVCISG